MTHPSPSPQPLRRSAGQACAGVHREHVRHYGWAWLTALLLILASALALPASAQTFPKFTGLVVDDANVLPPQVEADLTAKLEALQKDTKRQLVVATIGDLQGYPKEEYGYKLGRAWGVGMRDVNNGAILFIAPNAPAGRRGVRVEVGRGLEPVITDALSSVVINNDMLPKLRADDISGAMTAGADALIQQLRASPEEAQARLDAATRTFDQAHRRGESNGGGLALGAVIPLFVIGFIVLAMVRRGGGGGRRYRSQSDSGLGHVILWGIANEIASGALRGGGGGGSDGVRGWGGGSSGGSDGSWGGGGFTGGGGGDFGGGGASGDW